MPITGIDHVMLAVPDLAPAVADLAAALGLPATRGGVHPGFGTENKVIHVSGLYLEMITIREPEVAATWHVGRRIAEVISDRGGWLAFVLAAKDLPDTVRELNAIGLPVDEPIGGHAIRQDGAYRGFWVAGHGAEFESGRLPSIIEYTHPPEPDPHPAHIGYRVLGLARVDVAVDDFPRAVLHYSTLLGVLPALGTDTVLAADTAEFTLQDGTAVRLLGNGPARRQGLFGLAIAVNDIGKAAEAVTARSVTLSPTGITGELLLDSTRTLNARISLLPAAS